MLSVVYTGIFLISLLRIDVVSGTLTMPDHQHVAAVVGSTVNFTCMTNVTTDIKWVYKQTLSSNESLVFNGKKVVPRFKDSLSVSWDNNTRHSVLSIKIMGLNNSGGFICSEAVYQNAEKLVHDLSVTESPHVCSINYVAYEFDRLELKCSVNYSSLFQPEFYCTPTVANETVNSSVDNVAGGQFATLFYAKSVGATSDLNGTKFTCAINFTHDALTANWTSPAVRLAFGPSDVTISVPRVATDKHEELLTCNARGYPSPTFEWLDLETGESLFNGSQYTVDWCSRSQRKLPEIRHVRCVASNEVNGIIRNSSVNYTLPTTPHITACSGGIINDSSISSDYRWLSAIFIVALAIAIAGVAVFFKYRQATKCELIGKVGVSNPDVVSTALMTAASVSSTDSDVSSDRPELPPKVMTSNVTACDLQLNCNEFTNVQNVHNELQQVIIDSEPQYAELAATKNVHKPCKQKSANSAPSYVDIDHTANINNNRYRR